MISSIQNSIFFKHLLMLVTACFLFMSFTVYDQKVEVVLRAGTQIQLETTGHLRSDNVRVGQTIDFRVRQNVQVDGKTVIEAGSIAKGQVVRAQKARGIGREGFIEIQIRSVQAVDGQEVFLSGGNVYAEGDDKQVLSIVLGIFICILFLLIKGENAEIPPGYLITPSVASNTTINA